MSCLPRHSSPKRRGVVFRHELYFWNHEWSLSAMACPVECLSNKICRVILGGGFGGGLTEPFELLVDGCLKSFDAAVSQTDAVDKNSGCASDPGTTTV